MELTKDLAYILGALRDGSVLRYTDKTGKTQNYIAFYSKDTRWLKIISKPLTKTFSGHQVFCIPKTGTPYLRIYSKEIVEKIKKEFNHPLTSQITWRTPKIIMKTKDKDILKYYIAGFWDAEGSYDIRTNQIRFHLSWNGFECPPLIDMKKILKRFEIKCGNVGIYENKNGNFPRFVLRLSKFCNEKFLKDIPIQNPSKIEKIGNLTAK